MTIHEETVALALGKTETPMERLQRQRDEARAELEAMVAVAWRIKKPAHTGEGWWLFTDRGDFEDALKAWREEGYELVHETLYSRGQS